MLWTKEEEFPQKHQVNVTVMMGQTGRDLVHHLQLSEAVPSSSSDVMSTSRSLLSWGAGCWAGSCREDILPFHQKQASTTLPVPESEARDPKAPLEPHLDRCVSTRGPQVSDLPLQLGSGLLAVLEAVLSGSQPQQLLLQQAVLSLQQQQLTSGWSCSGLPVGSRGPSGPSGPSCLSGPSCPSCLSGPRGASSSLLRLLQQLQDRVLLDNCSLERSHNNHHLLKAQPSTRRAAVTVVTLAAFVSGPKPLSEQKNWDQTNTRG